MQFRVVDVWCYCWWRAAVEFVCVDVAVVVFVDGGTLFLFVPLTNWIGFDDVDAVMFNEDTVFDGVVTVF